MRNISALALVSTLALNISGCGGSPAPVTPAPASSAAPDAGAPIAPLANPAPAPAAPLVDATLPKDPLWIASVDASKLLAGLPNGLGDMLQNAMGVPSGSLDLIGLDVTRPITIAQMPITAEQRNALARLRAIPVVPGTNMATPYKKAISNVNFGTAFRVVLPATDPSKMVAALGLMLAANKIPSAGNNVFEGNHMRVALSSAKDAVVVDAGIGDAPKASLESLRAQIAAGSSVAPPLEGRVVRAISTPAAIIELGDVTRALTYGAVVSSTGLDDSQRSRIAAELLKELALGRAFSEAPFSVR